MRYSLGATSILLLLLLALSTAAQTLCSLTPKAAPELAGFKLGMTTAEAGLDLKTSPWLATTGWATDLLTPQELNRIAQGRGDGIEEVGLGFFKGRIIAIRLVYNSSKWVDFANFQKYITEKFKLPDAWPTLDPFADIEENLMRCTELEIFIRYFGGSRATIIIEAVTFDERQHRIGLIAEPGTKLVKPKP